MKYLVTVSGRPHEVEVDGETVRVNGKVLRATLTDVAGTPLRQLLVDGKASLIALTPQGRGAWSALARGEQFDIEVLDERTRHIRDLAGVAKPEAAGGVLRAPMPGLVAKVLTSPGAQVARGDGVIILEAMKMENELKAPGAGVVTRILVQPGGAVEKGAVLIEFGPSEGT